MKRRAPLLAFLALLAPLALPACSGDDSSSGTSTGDASSSTTEAVDPNCGSGKPIAGAGENKMATWGAPCTTDAECVTLLGDGALCYAAIANVYKAPAGYCSKPCSLPDGVQYSESDPQCGDGVTCLGVNGIFTACVPPCTDDAQCQRDGYSCTLLPQIGSPGDPEFCLMMDTCMVMTTM